MKIANNITINPEIKTTEEGENYKNYSVIDSEGFVLEVGLCLVDDTIQDILARTGIEFGTSAWEIQ